MPFRAGRTRPGQFGAASYAFPNGWFSANSKGSPARGKNYFFGGTTTEAVQAKASIGTQAIKLPAAAAGRKVTLSGWLGNYGKNTSQVRAEFADAGGKVLARLRIGPDTTIVEHRHGPSQQDRDGAPRSDAGDGRRHVHRVEPTTTSPARTTSRSSSRKHEGIE